MEARAREIVTTEVQVRAFIQMASAQMAVKDVPLQMDGSVAVETEIIQYLAYSVEVEHPVQNLLQAMVGLAAAADILVAQVVAMGCASTQPQAASLQPALTQPTTG